MISHQWCRPGQTDWFRAACCGGHPVREPDGSYGFSGAPVSSQGQQCAPSLPGSIGFAQVNRVSVQTPWAARYEPTNVSTINQAV